MVANGHSWSSLKQYSLSEIGIFYKTVILQEREKKAENLFDLWMGNNLEYKGIQEVVTKLGIKQQKKIGPTDAEVNQNWLNLAGALKGK